LGNTANDHDEITATTANDCGTSGLNYGMDCHNNIVTNAVSAMGGLGRRLPGTIAIARSQRIIAQWRRQ
jgi:hypothetical protein